MSPAIIIKAMDTYIYPIIPVLPWKFLSEDIIFFYKYIIILENSYFKWKYSLEFILTKFTIDRFIKVFIKIFY